MNGGISFLLLYLLKENLKAALSFEQPIACKTCEPVLLTEEHALPEEQETPNKSKLYINISANSVAVKSKSTNLFNQC